MRSYCYTYIHVHAPHGTRQKLHSRYFSDKVAENNFSAEMGGSPLPPLMENHRKCSQKDGSKRVKICVVLEKIAVFSGFFLTGVGGYAPPP